MRSTNGVALRPQTALTSLQTVSCLWIIKNMSQKFFSHQEGQAHTPKPSSQFEWSSLTMCVANRRRAQWEWKINIFINFYVLIIHESQWLDHYRVRPVYSVTHCRHSFRNGPCLLRSKPIICASYFIENKLLAWKAALLRWSSSPSARMSLKCAKVNRCPAQRAIFRWLLAML